MNAKRAKATRRLAKEASRGIPDKVYASQQHQRLVHDMDNGMSALRDVGSTTYLRAGCGRWIYQHFKRGVSNHDVTR